MYARLPVGKAVLGEGGNQVDDVFTGNVSTGPMPSGLSSDLRLVPGGKPEQIVAEAVSELIRALFPPSFWQEAFYS